MVFANLKNGDYFIWTHDRLRGLYRRRTAHIIYVVKFDNDHSSLTETKSYRFFSPDMEVSRVSI